MVNELMKASTLGNVAQIKSLVAGGVDVETQDDLRWRPIHMAAERGQPQRVRALAKLGADERPRQQRHAAGVLGSDTGARRDSQGVCGG
jgi:ankyrin repeat protein